VKAAALHRFAPISGALQSSDQPRPSAPADAPDILS
jgi:hypothetical protein